MFQCEFVIADSAKTSNDEVSFVYFVHSVPAVGQFINFTSSEEHTSEVYEVVQVFHVFENVPDDKNKHYVNIRVKKAKRA